MQDRLPELPLPLLYLCPNGYINFEFFMKYGFDMAVHWQPEDHELFDAAVQQGLV